MALGSWEERFLCSEVAVPSRAANVDEAEETGGLERVGAEAGAECPDTVHLNTGIGTRARAIGGSSDVVWRGRASRV